MAGDRRPREWAGAGEEGDRGSPGRDSLESSPHPEAFVRIRPRGPRGVARPRRLPARVPFRRERGHPWGGYRSHAPRPPRPCSSGHDAPLPRPIRRPRPGGCRHPDVESERDRVPEFIAFLVDLTRRHGTTAGIYGHIGDGNTHYRPFFDPTDPQDFERMRALREEFDHTVLNRFRGAPSGEHGIGRIRAETLPRVWGSEVYGVMRRIKEALDPRGLLNPGVLFSSDPWWATWGGLESRVPM